MIEVENEASEGDQLAKKILGQVLPPGFALGHKLIKITATERPESRTTLFALMFDDETALYIEAVAWEMSA